MSKKVMVVDDSRFIWEEMKHILTGTEFDIVSFAKTGEEAIEFYQRDLPELVTLDIILPGMDGMDVAKLLLEKWPKVKIIMVSSLAYDDTVTEAKGLGVADFVFKPFDKEGLLEVLRRV